MHKKKKLLGLQRNQIFNQGSFSVGDGWGCTVIWRNVRTSKKIPATPPDSKEKQMMLTLSIVPVYAYMIDSTYKSYAFYGASKCD